MFGIRNKFVESREVENYFFLQNSRNAFFSQGNTFCTFLCIIFNDVKISGRYRNLILIEYKLMTLFGEGS
jgi:hypothetical protein